MARRRAGAITTRRKFPNFPIGRGRQRARISRNKYRGYEPRRGVPETLRRLWRGGGRARLQHDGNFRIFRSDAAASVRGFQGTNIADTNRVVACLKHYVGYGAAEGGRDYNTTEISEFSDRTRPPACADFKEQTSRIRTASWRA